MTIDQAVHVARAQAAMRGEAAPSDVRAVATSRSATECVMADSASTDGATADADVIVVQMQGTFTGPRAPRG